MIGLALSYDGAERTFGIACGITPAGLFTRLRPQGVDVTLEQCERFITDYFNAYSGVQKFINSKVSLRRRGTGKRSEAPQGRH
jgi:DNA polymerase I-like protein with 3'-5' exonuclease and polymerase domains